MKKVLKEQLSQIELNKTNCYFVLRDGQIFNARVKTIEKDHLVAVVDYPKGIIHIYFDDIFNLKLSN